VNIATVGIGAIMGREECRERVTCNACKLLTNEVPTTKMAFVVTDNLVGDKVRTWDKYQFVKKAILDDNMDCYKTFYCQILYEEDNEDVDENGFNSVRSNDIP
jgi:hypothetical protein